MEGALDDNETTDTRVVDAEVVDIGVLDVEVMGTKVVVFEDVAIVEVDKIVDEENVVFATEHCACSVVE